MRPDTTFSERKLSNEEFSAKYWMGGMTPYQYHTARIEDGRDEREQFVFNNIRALYNIHTEHTVAELRRIKADLLDIKRKLGEESGSKKASNILKFSTDFFSIDDILQEVERIRKSHPNTTAIIEVTYQKGDYINFDE